MDGVGSPEQDANPLVVPNDRSAITTATRARALGGLRAFGLLGVCMGVPPLAFAAAFRLAARAIEVYDGATGPGDMPPLEFIFLGPPVVLLSVVAAYLIARAWVAAVTSVESDTPTSTVSAWEMFLSANNRAVDRITGRLLIGVVVVCGLAIYVPLVFTTDAKPRLFVELAGPPVVLLPLLIASAPLIRRNMLAVPGSGARDSSNSPTTNAIALAATIGLTTAAALAAHVLTPPADFQSELGTANLGPAAAAIILNLATAALAIRALKASSRQPRHS